MFDRLKRLLLLFFITIISLNFSVVCSGTDNYPCSVVEYLTKCVVERNRCTVEKTMLVEIRDRTAEKYTIISIPYSKKDKVSIISAQIEDQQGNVIRELKKSDFLDKSAISGFSLYEDRFVKTFELRHNVYPYRIRYQWKYDYEEFIDIVNWFPYLDELITTQHAKLEVQVPRDYPVKIYNNKVDRIKTDTLETSIIYTFEVIDVELPADEYDAISTKKIASNVEVLPVNFKWSVEGSHLNWKELGNWIYNLNVGSDNLPEADKEKVRSMTKNLSNKRAIIDVLYKYIQQNTRYINVSIGIGGLKPYPASYVAVNKYGDCKALSVYMKSMLDVVNIPSYYTIIYAGDENPGVTKEIARLQFNHVILTVPLDKDTLYIDCTRQHVPVGYMGTFTQGREAFVIKKDSSYFVKIPVLKPHEVLEENLHVYNLGVNTCDVTMQNKARGAKFDYLSSIDENLNHSEAENYLREKYFYFPSFDLKNWALKQPHNDSTYVLLKASLQLNNYLKQYGADLGFQLYPLEVYNYEKPSDRKLPLLFEYPESIADTFIYKLSSPLQSKLLPPAQVIESRFGKYSLRTVFFPGEIQVYRNFEIFAGEYPLELYPEFYDFIQKVRKNNKLIILLSKQN